MQDFYPTTKPKLLIRWLVLFNILCLISSPIIAEQNINPEINQHYQNPDFDHWVSIFERSGREIYDQRNAIVDQLTIRPGMSIADVGAGTGLFSRIFAQRVGPSGKVYAVDISKNFVDNILRTAKDQGLNNIVGLISTQQDSKLPPDSVELVFVCDTYHHFEYPKTMLASLHSALKANGQLVIIDFVKQPGISSDWILSHVRADKRTTIDEIQRAGFKLASESNLLRSNYFLVFKKSETPAK